MTGREAREEIECLIRSRYPVLYILTSEESRVQGFLQDIARKLDKRIYEWTCTLGLVPAGTSIQSQHARNSPTREPLAALDQVIDQVEPALFVFKDLHPFLGKSHHGVIRKLKEIALQLKNSFKTVILVSPVLEIPAELEKELTLIEYPLPEREDLDQLLNEIIEEVQTQGLVEISLDPTGRQRLLQAAIGLTLGEAENVFAKILVKRERLTGDDVSEVLLEKQQIIRKSGLLEYYPSDATFAEVGGLWELKDWLNQRSIAFTDEARAFGLPAPRGILLIGMQGCGKSLCAKAVAQRWQVPLLRFDVGRMFGSLMGSSEENVRRAIAVAESVAPAVLWVDELDKAFAGLQGSGVSDGGTTARVFATFLTWLSEKESPVFVVATANEISHLPPELLRKGRLDEIFYVEMPAPEERAEIFSIHLVRRGRDPQHFDLSALVEASEGHSGSELEQSIISAMYEAFSLGTDVTTDLILKALSQTVPLVRTMAEQIASLRAWAVGRARNASRCS